MFGVGSETAIRKRTECTHTRTRDRFDHSRPPRNSCQKRYASAALSDLNPVKSETGRRTNTSTRSRVLGEHSSRSPLEAAGNGVGDPRRRIEAVDSARSATAAFESFAGGRIDACASAPLTVRRSIRPSGHRSAVWEERTHAKTASEIVVYESPLERRRLDATAVRANRPVGVVISLDSSVRASIRRHGLQAYYCNNFSDGLPAMPETMVVNGDWSVGRTNARRPRAAVGERQLCTAPQ